MMDPLQTIPTNTLGQPNQVHSQAFTKICLAPQSVHFQVCVSTGTDEVGGDCQLVDRG